MKIPSLLFVPISLSIISICLPNFGESLKLREAIKLPWQLFKPGHVSQLDLPRRKLYLIYNNGSSFLFESHYIDSGLLETSIELDKPAEECKYFYSSFSSDRSYLKILAMIDRYIIYFRINLLGEITLKDTFRSPYVYRKTALTSPLWIGDDAVVVHIENPNFYQDQLKRLKNVK